MFGLSEIQKPNWMTNAEYLAFMRTLPLVQRCIDCVDDGMMFDRSFLTIDHIIPRALGGTNELSNLTIRCAWHNRLKGVRPDQYWSRHLYLDGPADLAQARHLITELWLKITEEYAAYFGRLPSELAGVMHVVGAATGAGKTVAEFFVPLALNYVLRRQYAGLDGIPRYDRMLVLTRSEQLRDQLAEAMTRDIVRYGHMPTEPAITIIKNLADLAQPSTIARLDIAIACTQMFFEQNGEPKPGLEEHLAKFPLAIGDEMHFAYRQLLQLVKRSPRTAWFGFTATPIDADARLLKDLVRVHAYGYTDARDQDGSMKYVPEAVDDLVTIVRTREGGILRDAGPVTTTPQGYEAAWESSIEAQRSVVVEAFKVMAACDLVWHGQAPRTLAPHRDQAKYVPELVFPAHVIVAVPNIEEGEALMRWANQYLANHRVEYPLEDGYEADFVNSGDPGRNMKPRPLNTSHPWFWTDMLRRTTPGWAGELAPGSKRILFVVGMGREGCDNPECTIVARCTPTDSVVEVVQLDLGRPVRAIVDGNRVPAAELDRVHIVTHESYGMRAIYQEALGFVHNFSERMEADTLGLEQPIDGTGDGTIAPITPEVPFTTRQKLESVICFEDTDRSEAAIGDISYTFFPEDRHSEQRKRVQEWLTTYRDDPERTAQRLGLQRSLPRIDVLAWEAMRLEPTDNQLLMFMQRQDPESVLNNPDPFADPTARRFAELAYRLYHKNLEPGHLPAATNIEDLKRAMAGRVVNDLVGRLSEADRHRVYGLVGSALRQCLGATTLPNRSVWNVAQTHLRLQRADVQEHIRAWVLGRLIERGAVPGLNGLAGFVSPSEVDDDVAVAP